MRRIRSGALVLCCVLPAVAGCGPAGSEGRAPATAEGADESHAVVDSAAFAAADSIVADWVTSGRIAGAVLSVASTSRPPTQRAYGFAALFGYGNGQYPGDAGPARLEAPLPMAVGTRFDLASVTKVAATTSALMLLVDRGVVELEAPARRYLPGFEGEGREDVSVEDLLTHRSGLPQWLPVYYHADDPDDAWAYVRSRPLQWPVGAERRYSDLGFMTLGRLVEAVSGQPLDAFVRAELYTPLGMLDTDFRPEVTDPALFAHTSHGNPFERRMVHDPDFGYRIDGDPEAWEDWRRYTLVGEVNDGNAHHAFRGVAGHAGLFSTAADLQRLLRFWLDGGVAPGGERLAQGGTVDRFLAPTGDDQALGWQLPSWAPTGSFGHTGFTGTFVLAVPDLGLSIVLLTNRQNTGVDAETTYVDVGPLQRSVVAALTAAPAQR